MVTGVVNLLLPAVEIQGGGAISAAGVVNPTLIWLPTCAAGVVNPILM